MILRAAVVDVFPISALGLLRLRFAGDGATAVAALDQFTGVGHHWRRRYVWTFLAPWIGSE